MFLKILEAIFGAGENLIPVLIHNKNSTKPQQIEAVIVSTLEGVLTAFPPPAATTTQAAPPA